MSNTVSNEKFLLCCMKHNSGGTINWKLVADECALPSNGAAAIKFRRLKEKFDSTETTIGGPGVDTPTAGTPTKNSTPKKPASTKKGIAKKRKLTDNIVDEEDGEDVDSPVKGENIEEE